jgi:cytochrome d ubiquinol oxidase subunit I
VLQYIVGCEKINTKKFFFILRYSFVHLHGFLQKIYIYLVPLPYLAIILGWMVAEMGRQPYIIYGFMEVSEGISDVPVSQVWFSLISLQSFM